MTIIDLSRVLSVSWGLIKEIDKQGLKHRYRHMALSDVRYIAIDEFSIKKGHKYMTVVWILIQSGFSSLMGEEVRIVRNRYSKDSTYKM